MAESSNPSPDVIRVLSPLFFGPLFNWALYGVLCVQIYVYSYNFPNDRRSIKILAFFVFVLETAQTALTGADVYYWFVAGFGNVERLGNSHFAPIDVSIITGLIAFIVQGYFCYRIWVLNRRSSWFCWIIVVCAVTQAVATTWLGVTSLKVGKYVVSKAAVYVWSIPSALADILIAVAMTLMLRRASSNFSSIVIIRVVRLTIETNALTAALAITALVLYAAFPNQLYYAYITEIIGKLYSNTLLVSLNNRIYFREHRSSGRGNNVGLSVFKKIHSTAVTPPCSAGPEPQSQASKGDTFPLYSIFQPASQDNSKSDDTSIDWSLPHPGKCHILPEVPGWTVGTSIRPYARQDEMYGV
ncbi:hypothetical protein EDB92DRAFT_1944229 [Lactarius akahatsu]|uniref:DUF6534 domain-containing protein n=1 Tax=Lactarius akahatsu TaxID=416441 RepID=A0AAD4QEP9_9AGAM|nr:hypothetical protein EDB92DRAFT_1944229 [Lactarius akahatsu]